MEPEDPGDQVKVQIVPSASDQVLMVANDETMEQVSIEAASLSSVVQSMLAGTQILGSQRFYFREAVERKIYFPSIDGDILKQVTAYLNDVQRLKDEKKSLQADLNRVQNLHQLQHDEVRRLQLLSDRGTLFRRAQIKLDELAHELESLRTTRLTSSVSFQPNPELAVELLMAAAYLELPGLVDLCIATICEYFDSLPAFGDVPNELILRIVAQLDNVDHLCRAEHLLRIEHKDVSCSAGWRRLYAAQHLDTWHWALHKAHNRLHYLSSLNVPPVYALEARNIIDTSPKSLLDRTVSPASDRLIRLVCIEWHLTRTLNTTVHDQDDDVALGRTIKMLAPVVRRVQLSPSTPLSATDLFSLCSHLTNLHFLDLTGAQVDEEGGEAVAAGLIAAGLRTQIRHLDLHNTGLTVQGCEHLCTALIKSYAVLDAYNKRRKQAGVLLLDSNGGAAASDLNDNEENTHTEASQVPAAQERKRVQILDPYNPAGTIHVRKTPTNHIQRLRETMDKRRKRMLDKSSLSVASVNSLRSMSKTVAELSIVERPALAPSHHLRSAQLTQQTPVDELFQIREQMAYVTSTSTAAAAASTASDTRSSSTSASARRPSSKAADRSTKLRPVAKSFKVRTIEDYQFNDREQRKRDAKRLRNQIVDRGGPVLEPVVSEEAFASVEKALRMDLGAKHRRTILELREAMLKEQELEANDQAQQNDGDAIENDTPSDGTRPMTAASVATQLSQRLGSSRDESRRRDIEEQRKQRSMDEIPRFLLRKVPAHRLARVQGSANRVGHLEGNVVDSKGGYVRVRDMVHHKERPAALSEREEIERAAAEMEAEQLERVRMANNFAMVASVRNADDTMHQAQSSLYRTQHGTRRGRIQHHKGFVSGRNVNTVLEDEVRRHYEHHRTHAPHDDLQWTDASSARGAKQKHNHDDDDYFSRFDKTSSSSSSTKSSSGSETMSPRRRESKRHARRGKDKASTTTATASTNNSSNQDTKAQESTSVAGREGATIVLRHNELLDGCATLMAQRLLDSPEMCVLQTLDLSRNTVGEAGAVAMANVLSRRHCQLRYLDMSGCALDNEGMQALLQAMCRNKSVLWLALNANIDPVSGVAEETADALEDMLESNSVLERLELARNPLGAIGCHAISKGLGENSTLQMLKLASVAMSGAGATHIARGIQHNGNVRELDVSDNELEAEGTREFAAMLCHAAHMHTLDLGGNELNQECGEALAVAVAKCTSLVELRLNGPLGSRGERLANRGTSAFAMGLANNVSLQRLFLERQEIRSTGCAQLAVALQGHPTIQELHLGHNRISERGAEALVDLAKDILVDQDKLQVLREMQAVQEAALRKRRQTAAFIDEEEEQKAAAGSVDLLAQMPLNGRRMFVDLEDNLVQGLPEGLDLLQGHLCIVGVDEM